MRALMQSIPTFATAFVANSNKRCTTSIPDGAHKMRPDGWFSVREESMFRSLKRRTIRPVLQHAYRSPNDARRAGGDFVVARRHFDRTVTFMVIDLWAKAAEADYYADQMEHAFRKLSLTVLSPARMLSHLDREFSRHLRARSDIEGTASAFVVTCDTNGNVRYAAAGTDTALLFRGPVRHLHLESTGPLLGFDNTQGFSEKGFTLQADDLLVVCTDGITEARSGWPERSQLGTRGLAGILQQLISAKGKPTCDDLMERVGDWVGGEFQDDATAVFVTPGSRAAEQSESASFSSSLQNDRRPASSLTRVSDLRRPIEAVR
jgi:Stage II sporulation protein E (SpoIIE)